MMWHLLILLLTVALFNRPTTAQGDEVSTCGKLNLKQLYNGQILAELDEFPWTGAVIMKDNNGERYTECGAMLINEHYLLTNAYCFRNNSNPAEIRVILGFWKLLDLDAGIKSNCDNNNRCGPLPRLYHIEEIVQHPNFTGIENDDIALIRLQETVEFTDYIQPVCLPSKENSQNDFVSQTLIYMGWPQTDSNSTALYKKSKLFTYVLDLQTCNENFETNTYTADAYICAYCMRPEKFSTGSAVLGVSVKNSKPNHYFLMGLFTWRNGFCDFKSPDVFVRIDHYLDWINSKMH